MKKLTGILLAGLVALLGVGLAAPAAQAYPDPAVTFTVDHQVVVGGHAVTGHVHSSVSCHWTLSFMGHTRSGTGRTFSATFPTPEVSTRQHHDMVATCTYAASNGRQASITKRIAITLTPVSASSGSSGTQAAGAPTSDGSLPNTGGPSVLLVIAGVLLVLLGSAALAVSRRRRVTA